MKVLLADTVYPDFLKTLTFDENSTYEAELRKVLDAKFGTSSFYSDNLRTLGHECCDVIANYNQLQIQWCRGYWDAFQVGMLLTGNQFVTSGEILNAQIDYYQPDVVFLQDLSLVEVIRHRGKEKYVVAAQCSCAMRDEQAAFCDVIFSSFPFYIPRIEALNVKAVYLPLAFEPSVLEGPQPERDIDISFVGGVGRDLHWQQGTDVLEAIAAAFPDRFQWWGYGLDRLSADSPLRRCYKGEAWGRDLYSVYRRSKIVVTRHGEVAQGYTNNLRCFEACGSGAMLFTETSPNLRYLFPNGTAESYEGAADLCSKITFYLAHDDERIAIADAGQKHIVRSHTYEIRMQTVSRVLSECLESEFISRR